MMYYKRDPGPLPDRIRTIYSMKVHAGFWQDTKRPEAFNLLGCGLDINSGMQDL